jgi:hypothetical protein
LIAEAQRALDSSKSVLRIATARFKSKPFVARFASSLYTRPFTLVNVFERILDNLRSSPFARFHSVEQVRASERIR